MRIQAVEDGAVGRVLTDARGIGADQPEGRPRQKEAAVGIGLTRRRAEPAVGQRERLCQRVVEGQVLLVPVRAWRWARPRQSRPCARRLPHDGCPTTTAKVRPTDTATAPAGRRCSRPRRDLRSPGARRRQRRSRRPRAGLGARACRSSCQRSGSPSSPPPGGQRQRRGGLSRRTGGVGQGVGAAHPRSGGSRQQRRGGQRGPRQQSAPCAQDGAAREPSWPGGRVGLRWACRGCGSPMAVSKGTSAGPVVRYVCPCAACSVPTPCSPR